MSTIPTFVNEQSGETTCADHAGRYLTAALNKRPDLKTTNTPLGRWIRVNGDEYACETCSPISTRTTTTPSKENTNMPTTIAVPVRKSKKTAPKTAAKKETAVPAKTTTKKATTKAAPKPVAKKAAPKKAEPKKAAPKAAPAAKAKRTVEPKMFLVYRNITSDVTAQARNAKSFDPIRYEGVLSGKTITAARKALDELKGDDAAKYDVAYSYDDKLLTQNALKRFDGAKERVTSKGKGVFNVIVKNIKGLTDEEVQELALYVWTVDAGEKATKLTGNERMLDRDFKFEPVKSLKNDRASVTFTAM